MLCITEETSNSNDVGERLDPANQNQVHIRNKRGKKRRKKKQKLNVIPFEAGMDSTSYWNSLRTTKDCPGKMNRRNLKYS